MTQPVGPIRLDPSVERYGEGDVLLEPRSVRLVRLSTAGVRALRRLEEGAPRSPGEAALRRRLVRAGLAHPRPRACPGHAVGDGGLARQVSVLVPVRDRPEALGRCLAAVRAGSPPGIEVVVVDDGSADPGRTAAVCATFGARLVALADGRGPAGARNAGLATLHRPLVALLDSDCRPTPGWLELLAAHLEDPEVVAVAPRVRPAGVVGAATASLAGSGGGPGRGRRAQPRAIERYLAVRSPLDLGPSPAEVAPGARVAYVPSAALLLRRTALEAGFDPDLRYGEDVDLIWRLHRAGGRIRYEPAAEVAHDEPSAWTGLLGRRFRYGTSAGPLARRHPGALAPLRLSPWSAAALLAGLAGAPVVAAACVVVPAARLVGRLRPVGIPPWRAARLAGSGTLEAAEATGRAAWSLAAPALTLRALGALSAWRPIPAAGPNAGHARRRWGHARRRRRRGGLVAVGLLLGPPLREWRRRRPRLDPVRFSLACLADDLAYGAGVWWGAARAGTPGPLLVRLSRSSPRRSPGSPR